MSLRATRSAILAAVASGALFAPGAAKAIDYAPVDTPGPPLSVPQAALDASIECDGAVDNASVTPVLLVPATGVDPHANYSWNWEPALTNLGIPWCAVTLPGHSMDDIQIAGEYVVYAIRKMFHRAGREISIMGHSQGGMVPRWALRFWPDTRAMVDDQIGFAGSNHGSDADPDPTCANGCSAAFQQQHANSEFLKGLNSGQETFPGISYTEIYTHTDEVVTPNADDTGSSSVHGGGGDIENVATQDVCPLDTYEHLEIGTRDPAAYALAVDALQHPGPAVPANISPAVCPPANPNMPGINPMTLAADESAAAVVLLTSISTYPRVASEPPLKCYVTASCSSQAGQAGATAQTPYGPSKSKCRKAKKKHGKYRRKRCGKKKKKRGHR